MPIAYHTVWQYSQLKAVNNVNVCVFLLGDTLPSRTKRIDPSQFMLHRGGAGSQSQLQQSATGNQPQLSSPSRATTFHAQSANHNNQHVVEPCVEITHYLCIIYTNLHLYMIYFSADVIANDMLSVL